MTLDEPLANSQLLQLLSSQILTSTLTQGKPGMKIAHMLLIALLALSGQAFSQSVTPSESYLLAQVDPRDPPKERIQPRADVRQDVQTRNDDQSTNRPQPVRNAGLQECKGEFALCAASTCKLTGRNIKVNIADGKSTKEYPEVVCKCPIITEEIAMANGKPLSALAGVNQGNMKGSCAVPSPDKIWSLFAPLAVYPQESTTPQFQSKQFSQQVCSTGTGSNCFSFLCTRDKEATNGVKTATCSCPAGENPFGAPTQNSQFLAAAGAYYTSAQGGPQAACNQYPVSIPNIADLK